jgi:ribonuclease BN (tRNA processing enzyme)
VKITLAPSAVVAGEDGPPHFLTSFLVNDTLAIDAGSLGLMALADQTKIKHVFLSHSHIDHLASLPLFVEQTFDPNGPPVTIYGNEHVLGCLHSDIFNYRIWPDFIALTWNEKPLLKLQTLTPGKTISLAGLRITPVMVNHVVPTCGFIVDDGSAAAVFPGDTGPTEEIWQRANAIPHLRAVFLEATFPNALGELADVARHLTPALFAQEVAKLKSNIPIIAVHIKARHSARIIEELKALDLPNLEIGRAGKTYQL